MRIRTMILAASLCIGVAAAYAVAPFVTAWNIREAIKSGDAAYLADKVEWPRVKETLKTSLAAAALDLPPQGPAAADTAKPSLWQRLKTYIGKGAVNRMVENYANAEGLPKLFAYRQTYRSAVGHAEEPRTLANLPQRIASAWARVRRAEFTSPTRFEMEMADKTDPLRAFAGTLELVGLEWKLVALHVRQEKSNGLTGQPAPLALPAGDGEPPGRAGFLSRLRATGTARLADAARGDPMER